MIKPGTAHVGAPLKVQMSKVFKYAKGHYNLNFIFFRVQRKLKGIRIRLEKSFLCELIITLEFKT